MKTKTLRQSVWLPAPPETVYRTLMTSKGHAAFSGAPARISPRVGGKFTAWGGYIHGVNVTLLPGKRIVQTWRPSEATWPKEFYSQVRFELSAARGGTRLKFTHSRVLAEHAKHLSGGWKESYWDPLRKYLRATKKSRA